MTDTATLVSGSRSYLRDFPIFFEVDLGPIDVTTIRLPHPLVPASSLQVVAGVEPDAMVAVPAADLQVEERNGLLKLLKEEYIGKRVMVAGYHYSWFLDSDLTFHTDRVLHDVGYGQDFSDLNEVAPIVLDTVMLGVLVNALWSLATELALDIDVSTPEGMYIPARQRFTQVLQMMQYWQNMFKERMAALNLGTGRLEIFWLRRVARLTNRLVPLYQEREFDDRTWPDRLYPPIPEGVTVLEAAADENTVTVEEIGRYGWDISWPSLGTSGG